MKPRTAVITRLSRRTGDRFVYFEAGKPVTMAPAIALQGARRSQLRIRTKGDKPCGK